MGMTELTPTLIAWIQANHEQAKNTLGHLGESATCPYPLCVLVRQPESR